MTKIENDPRFVKVDYMESEGKILVYKKNEPYRRPFWVSRSSGDPKIDQIAGFNTHTVSGRAQAMSLIRLAEDELANGFPRNLVDQMRLDLDMQFGAEDPK